MRSTFSAAAGLMALSGLASAFPQASYGNYTFGNTTAGAGSAQPSGISNSTVSPLTESLYCPKLTGSVILSPKGAEFLLECATNHFGVIIDVTFNSTQYAKRQAVVAPSSIEDCLAACDTVSSCVATAFDVDERTCTLYSEIGASYTDASVDFAIRVSSSPASSASAGQTLTSTLYSTTVKTIASCAPTVTNCPLKSGAAAVVTEVIPVTSTDYICPVATVIPASPVACSCAYSASTVVVYSTTTVQGTVTVVAVATSVVAVPSASGTSYATTTVVGTAPLTTAPVTAGAVAATTSAGAAGASKTSGKASGTASSGLAGFTGAASNVKAGLGLMAGVAGFAALL